MVPETPEITGDTLSWEVSPADLRSGQLLVYLPVAFLGGHVGLVVFAGAVLVPAVVTDIAATDPRLLALAALLVLVGGPGSLLYLWPMLKNPDQRPSVDRQSVLANTSARGSLVASLLGTVALVGGSQLLGWWVRPVSAVVLLVVPAVLLWVLIDRGSVDRDAGTLTVWHQTADVRTLAGVRCYRFDTVTVCRLSYVEGAGGFGRPYLVTVPETVAAEVLEALERGVAADPEVDTRAPDPVARAVLAGVATLSFGTAGGAVLVLDATAVPLAVASGGLGCLFALGAFYVA